MHTIKSQLATMIVTSSCCDEVEPNGCTPHRTSLRPAVSCVLCRACCLACLVFLALCANQTKPRSSASRKYYSMHQFNMASFHPASSVVHAGSSCRPVVHMRPFHTLHIRAGPPPPRMLPVLVLRKPLSAAQTANYSMQTANYSVEHPLLCHVSASRAQNPAECGWTLARPSVCPAPLVL